MSQCAGATGHLGSTIVHQLLAEGHEVVGVVRTDAQAAEVAAKGATPFHGDVRAWLPAELGPVNACQPAAASVGHVAAWQICFHPSAQALPCTRPAMTAAACVQIEKPEGLWQEAAKADAVLHTAFIHDFARHHEAVDIELRLLKGFVDALEGKTLIVSSGAP